MHLTQWIPYQITMSASSERTRFAHVNTQDSPSPFQSFENVERPTNRQNKYVTRSLEKLCIPSIHLLMIFKENFKPFNSGFLTNCSENLFKMILGTRIS